MAKKKTKKEESSLVHMLLFGGLIGTAGYYLLKARPVSGLGGTLFSGAGAGTILAPMTTTSYYDDAVVAANSAAIEKLRAAYGNFVTRSSQLTSIPEKVIYGFMFVESNGNPHARNGVSRGLMQHDAWAKGGPQACIAEMRKADLLTPDIRAELVRLLGPATATAILKMPNQTPTKGSLVPEAKTYDPEINIFLGCCMLRYLFYKHTENGIIRLDRVIVNYNRGINVKVPPLSTEKLITSLNKITAAYIPKLVGRNGVLTTLIA